MGDKSLTYSIANLLYYWVKRPQDVETEGGEVEAVGKEGLSVLCTLGLLNKAALNESLNHTKTFHP